MKDRLVTILLAMAALAAFYLLIFPKPRPEGSGVPQPLSTEPRGGGYLGAMRWLEAKKIPVLAWHRRYDALSAEHGTPPSPLGNVLVVVMPAQTRARPQELEALDLWVRRGNTLLVLAALDDTPAWTLGIGRVVESIRDLTGLQFEVIEDEGEGDDAGSKPRQKAPLSAAIAAAARGTQLSIEPRATHPLLDGVHTVEVRSDLTASRWRAVSPQGGALLELARVSGNGDPALFLAGRGRGQIAVLPAASPFTNELIGKADNARLFANLVAWSRGTGGTVLFDDAHQGDLAEYDARRFFHDPRLHRTLGWAVLVWLVFVLGIQPLRARPRNWNPVDITSLIGMSGEFLASASTPAAAARRLMENFFNTQRRRLDLREDGTPVWDWLRQQAGAPREHLDELESMHARLLAGRRVDLVRLQYLLSKLQGNLS